MSQTTTAEDRCRGVLFGLAAGDKIGGPIRMAVRLAESLLDCGGFDPPDILGRNLAWWREGAFDTGPGSDRALELLASGIPVQEVTLRVHREFGGKTAGCNPAHRSPPLAMLRAQHSPMIRFAESFRLHEAMANFSLPRSTHARR